MPTDINYVVFSYLCTGVVWIWSVVQVLECAPVYLVSCGLSLKVLDFHFGLHLNVQSVVMCTDLEFVVTTAYVSLTGFVVIGPEFESGFSLTSIRC